MKHQTATCETHRDLRPRSRQGMGREQATMTPGQFRTLADKFERSEPPPWQGQNPQQYEISMTAHKMARYLREMADEESRQR